LIAKASLNEAFTSRDFTVIILGGVNMSRPASKLVTQGFKVSGVTPFEIYLMEENP